MRRALALLVVLLGTVAIAPGARAGSAIDANTFATDNAYCGDGTVTVEKTLVVQGGTGAFADGCSVTLTDKAQFKLINAVLSGPGAFEVTDGIAPKVDIKQTSLTMGGTIFVTPGCCVAGKDGARLQIIGSHVESTTTDVELSASAFANKGRVQVTDSEIKSGLESDDNINILASDVVTATGGKILVNGSTINAGASMIDIETYNGSTQVKNSTLTYGSYLITAFDGKCKSENNTPESPCT